MALAERFVQGAFVGQGAFGDVYCGTRRCSGKSDNDDKKEEKKVAIKTLKEPFDDWNTCKANAEILAMMTVQKDSIHPRIVELYETIYDPNAHQVHLIFEYLPHKSLHEFLEEEYQAKNRILDEATVQSLTHDILQGVAHCHCFGIIHRDIKPENLLMGYSQEDNRFLCKLADFSLARRIPKSHMTRSAPSTTEATPVGDAANRSKRPKVDNKNGSQRPYRYLPPEPQTSYIATRWYRPPEILLGETQCGPPVDIWSVGCILTELYELSPLFQGDSEIDQLDLIFQFLGSPTRDTWPEGCDLIEKRQLTWGPTAVGAQCYEGTIHRILGGRTTTTPTSCNPTKKSPHSIVITPVNHHHHRHGNGNTTTSSTADAEEQTKIHIQRISRSPSKAFELFRLLLVLNPSQRLSAAEALQHAYFLEHDAARQERTVTRTTGATPKCLGESIHLHGQNTDPTENHHTSPNSVAKVSVSRNLTDIYSAALFSDAAVAANGDKRSFYQRLPESIKRKQDEEFEEIFG